jgi:antitoxin ParD1/3/4
MPTKNVNLSDQQARFVRQNIDGGGFRNASEVVRAGLRLLEQQQRVDQLKLQTLRKLSKQAFAEIDQGDFEAIHPKNLNDFLDKLTPRTSSGGKSR